jgi:putative addiction module component (TIGR02574 family)
MMTGSTEVYSHALGLPLSQREELAMLLLDSLPGDDDAPVVVSKELKREIDRRIAERKAGTAKVIDIDTFIARVRAAAEGPVTK